MDNKNGIIELLHNVIKYDNKEFKIKLLKRSATSNVYKDINNNIVIKKIIKYKDYHVFEREIHILKILKNYHINVPKLIFYDINNQIMIMSYCGETITEKAFNSNLFYKEQLSNIIKVMKKLNIKHNDIKHESEILLYNDSIYLCDFGWATINGKLDSGINLSNKEKPSGFIDDDIFLLHKEYD
jgi:tRNA A-37 threonylcarbamoyl transferase component Bud32